MPDNLSAQERAYRAAKLREINERVLRDGPHQARPHADRARQFMPFSALKGYHELARSMEHVERSPIPSTDHYDPSSPSALEFP
ncbi:MAG: hypothetical protein IJC51_05270 [Eggerthellaceae bacterium]|nr:hypothetical protein [Eggerthellaceae bacterium]